MKNIGKKIRFTLVFVFFALAGTVFLKTFADENFENLEGKKQTFVVSAYYSPLPNQESYVRGTYEGDLRLNGNGTHGADGTAVYPGMIAAPKTYAFGTKLYIPGIGVGTVHDRGGAIVAKENYDRIDIWMGYGDEGRKKALQWGMRKVEGLVLDDKSIKNEVNFAVIPPAEMFSAAKKAISTVISGETTAEISSEKSAKEEISSLTIGSSGKSVENLQNFLRGEGFFEGESTGYFGERTAKSVLSFQKYYGLAGDENSPGAGIFGPKTRSKMEEIWALNDTLAAYKVDINLFSAGMELGDENFEVKTLQRALMSLGYFDETPTGKFGIKTQEAVLAFQKDQNIVKNASEKGAGIFGPQTQMALQQKLMERRKNLPTETVAKTKLVVRKES